MDKQPKYTPARPRSRSAGRYEPPQGPLARPSATATPEELEHIDRIPPILNSNGDQVPCCGVSFLPLVPQSYGRHIHPLYGDLQKPYHLQVPGFRVRPTSQNNTHWNRKFTSNYRWAPAGHRPMPMVLDPADQLFKFEPETHIDYPTPTSLQVFIDRYHFGVWTKMVNDTNYSLAFQAQVGTLAHFMAFASSHLSIIIKANAEYHSFEEYRLATIARHLNPTTAIYEPALTDTTQWLARYAPNLLPDPDTDDEAFVFIGGTHASQALDPFLDMFFGFPDRYLDHKCPWLFWRIQVNTELSWNDVPHMPGWAKTLRRTGYVGGDEALRNQPYVQQWLIRICGARYFYCRSVQPALRFYLPYHRRGRMEHEQPPNGMEPDYDLTKPSPWIDGDIDWILYGERDSEPPRE